MQKSVTWKSSEKGRRYYTLKIQTIGVGNINENGFNRQKNVKIINFKTI